MKVFIKPRLQKDKWSLYWKTSMATKTELLDPFELEVADGTTAAGLKAKVASLLSWEPVDRLLRLEGFEEPWELCALRGVELPDDTPLTAAGVTDGAEVTVVRKLLVAEGAWPRGVRGRRAPRCRQNVTSSSRALLAAAQRRCARLSGSERRVVENSTHAAPRARPVASLSRVEHRVK